MEWLLFAPILFAKSAYFFLLFVYIVVDTFGRRCGFDVERSWKWYDFWIGAFYDQEKRALYLIVIPCLVLRIRRKP